MLAVHSIFPTISAAQQPHLNTDVPLQRTTILCCSATVHPPHHCICTQTAETLCDARRCTRTCSPWRCLTTCPTTASCAIAAGAAGWRWWCGGALQASCSSCSALCRTHSSSKLCKRHNGASRRQARCWGCETPAPCSNSPGLERRKRALRHVPFMWADSLAWNHTQACVA